jgi:hypothetical protein
MTNMGAKSETTVPCSESVRDRIKGFKTGGESYDDVLCRMCTAYEAQQNAERNA